MRRKHNINYLCWVITQLLTGDTDLGLDQLDLAGIPHDLGLHQLDLAGIPHDTDLRLDQLDLAGIPHDLGLHQLDLAGIPHDTDLRLDQLDLAGIPHDVLSHGRDTCSHSQVNTQGTIYSVRAELGTCQFFFLLRHKCSAFKTCFNADTEEQPPSTHAGGHLPPSSVPPYGQPSHLLPTENLTHHGGHPPPLLAVKLIPPCTH